MDMLLSRLSVAALLSVVLLGTIVGAAGANPGRIPGPATVGLARADHIYLSAPGPIPDSPAYQRTIDYRAVTSLLNEAVTAWSGQQPEDFWNHYFDPSDKVGLMVDVQGQPPVPIALVEAIIQQLVAARVRADNILIFSRDERDLFAAGFSLRQDRPGVRCYGAASLGYRHGLSRILIDMCDKIINLAYLCPHLDLGLTGAVYNHLACVPREVGRQVTAEPQQLASVAARALLKQRAILHFIVALHPYYAVPSATDEHPRWEYAGLLLSSDPVAVDVAGLQILTDKRREEGITPTEPLVARQYLQAASDDYRLGQANRDQITVVTIGPQ